MDRYLIRILNGSLPLIFILFSSGCNTFQGAVNGADKDFQAVQKAFNEPSKPSHQKTLPTPAQSETRMQSETTSTTTTTTPAQEFVHDKNPQVLQEDMNVKPAPQKETTEIEETY